MSILPNFLRSLLLTSFLSFSAPVLLVGGMLASLCLLSYIPGIEIIGQSGVESVCQFLTTFGNGNPIEGVVVIGLTCALVGGLFDTYAFYRHQTLRTH